MEATLATIASTSSSRYARLIGVLQTGAFRHAEYRRYFCGLALSVIGSWMQTVAIAWLVLQLSHNSAYALALYGAFNWGPLLLFGLFAGALVDRVVHRDLLLATMVVAITIALLYAVLTTTHLITLPVVYLLALSSGVNSALFFPARQATVREMVGREDLPSAVALNSSAFNLARVIGPALGGLVIAAFGVATCFWLNAASFLAVILAILTVRRRPAPEHSGQTALQSIAEGFRYIRKVPALLGLFTLLFVASVFSANFNLVLPLFTKLVLFANADALGFLFAAHGLGSLAGALTMTAAGRYLLEPRRIVLGVLLLCAVELGFAIIPTFQQAIVLLFVIGWSFTLYIIGTNTLVQLLSPDRMQGRMVSLYSMLFIGTTPLGNFFAGAVAAAWGASAAVYVGGLITAVGGIMALLYFGKHAAAAPWPTVG